MDLLPDKFHGMTWIVFKMLIPRATVEYDMAHVDKVLEETQSQISVFRAPGATIVSTKGIILTMFYYMFLCSCLSS